ncbi:hypothetical protein FQN55_004904 [Onygenales sp. PD_40]|nr:hypothetical protein FQN55_004904 [Onygenales sp. PD_40]
MRLSRNTLWLIIGLIDGCVAGIIRDFDPLEHLGANSPWFAGPNVNHISSDIPAGCTVDQAAYIVRHGSRYPDAGAYEQWTELHEKIQSARFRARGSLKFIPDWDPVLSHPEQQIAQLSVTGYKELYDMGTTLRHRYPTFYTDNTPYFLWSNEFQRTIDSARLFARGYLGPNATTYGTVHAVNSTSPDSVGNSLATSDLCPNFADASGGDFAKKWDSIYLPPITKRLNRLLVGNLTLTDEDTSKFMYLCGFETQITGQRSPWCDVFSEREVMQYEYRQDLRYYYGTGPGAGKNMTVMYPVLQAVVGLLEDGPGMAAAKTPCEDGDVDGGNECTTPLPPLIVAFTHDNQINELVSITGVFDELEPLSPKRMGRNSIYSSSRVNPMRGTVAFERLNCSSSTSSEPINIRIRLNDAVYPLPTCHSGPGHSCPLTKYAAYVREKVRSEEVYGSFAAVCGLSESYGDGNGDGAATFFTDLTLGISREIAV